MKTFRPMIFLAFILLIVGLACSAVTGAGNAPTQPPATQEPAQPVNNPPTAVPPTEAPVATATDAPVDVSDAGRVSGHRERRRVQRIRP